MGGLCMKLVKVILENFRSYQERTEVEIDNLTAFIGKNDIGKSTILEALEIFFNNNLVKIDPSDACVYSDSKIVKIGCVFTDFPEEIVLDSSSKTDLISEFLVKKDGYLEIIKEYNCGLKNPKEKVMLKAYHPTKPELKDLIHLKNSELKNKVKQLGINTEDIDLRSNVSIRKAIREHYEDLELKEVLIPLETGDAKTIWTQLEKALPIYALFQSDRSSSDQDAEIQDPMKIAIIEALKTVQDDLENIKNTVTKKVLEIANDTLDKLKEIDEELANQLSPRFKNEPKWDKVFNITINGDDDIPINKRGSGVRRLILLNFFRAEAERKKRENQSSSIIYAIEEPETSQHPNNQILLIKALKELAETDNTQVLITTHVPAIASLLPTDSIRFIKKHANGTKQIYSKNTINFDEIAETLGIFPDVNREVKVLICVEGPTDVSFINHVSKLYHEKDSTYPDILNDKRIVIIPLGGNTLKDWVEHKYLRKLGIPEIHFYDLDNKDKPKYQEIVDKINARNDGSKAFMTDKREIENYIAPSLIKQIMNIDVEFDDFDDVPLIVAKALHEKDPNSKPWEQLDDKKIKKKVSSVKKRLSSEVVPAMTYDLLCKQDTNKIFEKLLTEIKMLCSDYIVAR